MDAYVDSGLQNTNHGTDPRLYVSYTGEIPITYLSLIKFDVSASRRLFDQERHVKLTCPTPAAPPVYRSRCAAPPRIGGEHRDLEQQASLRRQGQHAVGLVPAGTRERVQSPPRLARWGLHQLWPVPDGPRAGLSTPVALIRPRPATSQAGVFTTAHAHTDPHADRNPDGDADAHVFAHSHPDPVPTSTPRRFLHAPRLWCPPIPDSTTTRTRLWFDAYADAHADPVPTHTPPRRTPVAHPHAHRRLRRSYEPNDSFASAYPESRGSITSGASVHPATRTGSGWTSARPACRRLLESLPADYDLELYNSQGASWPPLACTASRTSTSPMGYSPSRWPTGCACPE